MRITILASGSRGDVQPYVALGKGLRAAGNGVRIVTHEDFQELVEAHGLEFWPVQGSVREIAESKEMSARIEGGNFLTLMAQMAKEATRAAVHLAEGGFAAAHGSDLLVGGLGGMYIGLALAEKLDLPFLQAHLVPLTPTREFAGVLIANPPGWVGGRLKSASHHLTRQLIWQSFRSADRVARQQVLGLRPAPFLGPYNARQTRALPILYGFSPAVLPHAADWGEAVHVTGYWFLEADQGWTPPAALTAFLEAGPPPVYVGFGSMSNRNPEESAALVLEALRRSGQRAILLSGWDGLRSRSLPESAFVIDSVPHAWLFPRMAAIVHHGGAGTTAASLRAGIPSIVIPFFGDQPFWGQRVAALGAGPQPIPRKRLTAERLAAAIRQAMTDQEMRRRAAHLGETLRAEDGVARAVELIGQAAARHALDGSLRA